jgi:short-subunit dehydrogenase
MTPSYEGKTIWIIGASSGIGRALAIELALQGALLVLSARNKDKLHDLNAELGGKHHVYPLDVTDAQACSDAVAVVQKRLSQIDSVIFMAAQYIPGSLLTMALSDVHSIVNVNLNGALNISSAVLPLLIAQQRGQFALCGSVAGYRGLPNSQPYSATKAALINLAESLKAEQPQLDIKIINPGFVRTPMTDKNDFTMPMMIEPQDAAKAIAKGLKSKSFEIHFPKKLTLIMKCLKFLPPFLYFKLARRAQ